MAHVVGQGMAFGQRQAGGLQHGKEAVRVRNAGHRNHGLLLPGPLRQRKAAPVCAHGLVMQGTARLVHGLAGGHGHRRGRLPGHQHDIHLARPGLAQRAGRQQPAIADAALVHHANLPVAQQGVVLQAVVADDDAHIRIELDHLARRMIAVRADDDRRIGAQMDQHRLVAADAGIGIGRDHHAVRGLRVAAIAARDDADAHADRLEVLHDGDGGGRLASTACHHIAHHQHRHRQTLALLVERAAALPAPGSPIQL